MEFIEYKYKDIGKIRSGKRLKKGYIVSENESDNKYIRVRDIKDGIIDINNVQYISDEAASFITRYKVAKNDVIISVVGTVGSVASIPNELDGAYLTENCNNLLVDETICLKEYLKYFLLSQQGQNEIFSHIVGTTQPKLPIYGIEDFKIKIPEIEYQNKIIKILNTINNKIILNKQINNNLYKIIKTEYEKFINELDAYELVRLKDIANISFGKRPKIKGDKFDIPLVGASGVMSYTDNYNLDADILIIGRVGTLGVVQRYFDKIWASDNTLIIKTMYNSSVECYLKNVDYISLNRGSTQPLITKNDISNLEIKFNKIKFEKFENTIKPLRDKIYLNELQNKILDKIRNILLQKLMNGEIDLAKIEI